MGKKRKMIPVCRGRLRSLYTHSATPSRAGLRSLHDALVGEKETSKAMIDVQTREKPNSDRADYVKGVRTQPDV